MQPADQDAVTEECVARLELSDEWRTWLLEHLAGGGTLHMLAKARDPRVSSLVLYRHCGAPAAMFAQRAGYHSGFSLRSELYVRYCRSHVRLPAYWSTAPHPAVHEAMQAVHGPLHWRFEAAYHQMVLPPSVPLRLDTPAGWRLRSLEQADVAWVEERWPYSGLQERGYLAACIASGPSCAAVDVRTGALGGFCLTHADGDVLGALHVEPHLRRQGLARWLLSSLAALVRADSRYRVVALNVAPENTASFGLVTSLGFVVTPQMPTIAWLYSHDYVRSGVE